MKVTIVLLALFGICYVSSMPSTERSSRLSKETGEQHKGIKNQNPSNATLTEETSTIRGKRNKKQKLTSTVLPSNTSNTADPEKEKKRSSTSKPEEEKKRSSTAEPEVEKKLSSTAKPDSTQQSSNPPSEITTEEQDETSTDFADDFSAESETSITGKENEIEGEDTMCTAEEDESSLRIPETLFWRTVFSLVFVIILLYFVYMNVYMYCRRKKNAKNFADISSKRLTESDSDSMQENDKDTKTG